MYAVVYSVQGTPVTQGSKAISRTGAMYETGKGWKAWREAVKQASLEQAQLTDTVLGGVRVTLIFRFTSPKKPKYKYPLKDVDKLCRAVLDGMVSGGIIEDDKHVVRLNAYKEYAETPGVLIRIDPA
jgi:Holliday junction resolvase RusA-like endonuclease